MKGMVSQNEIIDRLAVQAFASARALKSEIRNRILEHRKRNWYFTSISSQGPFISIKYKYKEKY